MSARITITLFGLVALVLGCKSPSVELADRCVAILVGGLTVLEQHQQEPEKAPAAFQAYMDANRAEIAELSEFAASMKARDGSPEQMATRRRFLENLKPLEARLAAIAEAYRANPAVLEAFAEIYGGNGVEPP